MRSLIGLGLVVFTIGCGSDGAALDNNHAPTDGGATGLDAHLASPNACTSACDCQPGIACQNGQCTAVATQTYCCESATCPSQAACQSMSGNFSTCVSATTASNGSNGSSGGTTAGTGSSGGIIGGLTGSGGGLPSLGDGGLAGLLTGSSGGIPSFGDGGLGGLTTGGTTGGTGYCDLIPCSDDTICTTLQCVSCGPNGMCQ